MKNKMVALITGSLIIFSSFTNVIVPSFAVGDNIAKSSSGFKSMSLVGEKGKNSDEILKNFMQQEFIATNIKNADYTIKSKKTEKSGNTVYKIQQTYKGFPVFGYSKNVLIDSSGAIKSVTGWDIPTLEKTNENTAIKITSDTAKKLVIKDLGFTPTDEVKTSAQKVLFLNGKTGYFCYLVKLSFLEPKPGNWYYFVDIYNGNIINKYNHMDGIAGTNTVNVGTGVLGDSKKINVVKNTKKTTYLQDNTRGNGIFTYTAKNSTKTPGTLFSNTSDLWNQNSQKAAIDAHFYAGVTYDYYSKTFGRNSYDDNGAPIKSTVHYSSGYNNAFWNGSQMVYGDGDGQTFIELSGALDVVAHELTHAVTESEVGLIYQNESGAINESLSDIFGTLIEFNYSSNANWTMGENIYTPSKKGDALRSLANPTLYGDPDNYSKRYTGSEDNGGVHTNSGIINKAAFLISEGGTSYGVTVQGIGKTKLGSILYRAICLYLTPNSTFSQLKAVSIQSAADLYGKTSKEVTCVSKGFDAVGVY